MAKLKGKARAKARKTKRMAYKQSKNCMLLLPNGGYKMISEKEADALKDGLGLQRLSERLKMFTQRLTSSSEML